MIACVAVVLALSVGGCSLIGSVVSTTVNTAAKLALPAAGVKAAMACIPEGTLVDTPRGPVAIEFLIPGDTVIGFDGAPVRVLQVHAYDENPETEFLAVSFADGSRVDLCGMHRIGGVRATEFAPGDRVATCMVASVERYRGVERSYDLLTEDAGYRIQGVPVNSMIEEMCAAARDGGLDK